MRSDYFTLALAINVLPNFLISFTEEEGNVDFKRIYMHDHHQVFKISLDFFSASLYMYL